MNVSRGEGLCVDNLRGGSLIVGKPRDLNRSRRRGIVGFQPNVEFMLVLGIRNRVVILDVEGSAGADFFAGWVAVLVQNQPCAEVLARFGAGRLGDRLRHVGVIGRIVARRILAAVGVVLDHNEVIGIHELTPLGVENYLADDILVRFIRIVPRPVSVPGVSSLALAVRRGRVTEVGDLSPLGEVEIERVLEFGIGVPSDELIGLAAGGVARRGGNGVLLDLLSVVDAEGRRLVGREMDLRHNRGIAAGRIEEHAETHHRPFGVDDHVIIRHGNVKVKGRGETGIGVPAVEVGAVRTVGRDIVRRAITIQRSFIEQCFVQNYRIIGRHDEIMLVACESDVYITFTRRKAFSFTGIIPGSIVITVFTDRETRDFLRRRPTAVAHLKREPFFIVVSACKRLAIIMHGIVCRILPVMKVHRIRLVCRRFAIISVVEHT